MAKRKYGNGSVRQRGNRWEARKRVDGVRKSKLFATRQEAEAWAANKPSEDSERIF